MKKNTSNQTGVGYLKFGKGKTVKEWEVPVEMDTAAFNALKAFGLKEIVKDDAVIISYAVRLALQASISNFKNKGSKKTRRE